MPSNHNIKDQRSYTTTRKRVKTITPNTTLMASGKWVADEAMTLGSGTTPIPVSFDKVLPGIEYTVSVSFYFGGAIIEGFVLAGTSDAQTDGITVHLRNTGTAPLNMAGLQIHVVAVYTPDAS
ncbi:MAG TPA: hypothetical protein VD794_07030 [Flavisolibacter sp.]|nr:hypothetical protein [Flavisolibacter sp.]